MGTPDIKAVLWDFGGVLTTSPFDAFSRYEVQNALQPGFIRRLNATNPDSNAWARLERSEVSLGQFAELFEAEAAAAGATIDALAVMGMLRGQLRPEMVEAVRRCHERLATGLLTNNFVGPDEDDSPLYRAVFDHFDVVIESSKVGYRKPDPRFYQMACEQLGISADQAVFLDDLGINLKPARAMGMRTIKVTDPRLALTELGEMVGFDVG